MKRYHNNTRIWFDDESGAFGVDPRYPSDPGIDHGLVRRWMGSSEAQVIVDPDGQCYLCAATVNPQASQPSDAIVFDRVTPRFESEAFLMGWIRQRLREGRAPEVLEFHVLRDAWKGREPNV